ncbi:MAG: radical SAM protein [Lachnospiraceae bacterium]|jgi:putative pyruvate formate lyase activating enzyme|nr:radical SAM protein [Lachnospiraceae bacterium]
MERITRQSYENCTLCPRMCRVDRRQISGFCGCMSILKGARASLHHWEEPCISGNRGSGTVFFTGCTLRCCFCQNFQISQEGIGKELSSSQLARIFLSLQNQGAHNINLVTPTQFLPHILEAICLARPELNIPIVYNSSGYERKEIIDALDGFADIYLPDFKYFDPSLSRRYSHAGDYFSAASEAILPMIQQKGAPVLDPESGLLKSGVMIRHMVLPGAKEDSIKLLRWIKETLPPKSFLISLLSQYTPFYQSGRYPELNRRITSYEYSKVLEEAIRLGLTDGYMQKKSSARKEYTPLFNFEGLDV